MHCFTCCVEYSIIKIKNDIYHGLIVSDDIRINKAKCVITKDSEMNIKIPLYYWIQNDMWGC